MSNMIAELRELLERFPDFAQLRDHIIAEGEVAFEELTRPFPHVLVCPVPEDNQAMFDYIDRAQALLAANFPPWHYLAFPTQAIGKYKECCNNVYFVDEADLLIFKLSFM